MWKGSAEKVAFRGYRASRLYAVFSKKWRSLSPSAPTSTTHFLRFRWPGWDFIHASRDQVEAEEPLQGAQTVVLAEPCAWPP